MITMSRKKGQKSKDLYYKVRQFFIDNPGETVTEDFIMEKFVMVQSHANKVLNTLTTEKVIEKIEREEGHLTHYLLNPRGGQYE